MSALPSTRPHGRASSRAPEAPIRVLVADDQPEMCGALADVILDDPSLELVGIAHDAGEAIEMARSRRPDVVLLDVAMPEGGGPRAAREIRALRPATATIALSAFRDEDRVLRMLAEGAAGYLVKGTPSGEIVDAIRRGARGETSLSTEVATGVVHALASRLGEERAESVSWVERVERIQRIAEGEGLAMVFQPIVHLDTKRTMGFEALARIQAEPPRSTEAWFAEAAAVGLGPELELAAAGRAIDAAGDLPPDTILSLNFGPETVASAALRELVEGLPCDRLVIELTEHAPLDDYAGVKGAFQRLRWQGVRLAIDDLGAGYASLRHILELGPDFIKLDATLVRDVHRRPAGKVLIGALTGFAGQIGSEIVAEGIETEEECATLRTLGVTLGQGHFLAIPAPADRWRDP